MRLISLPPPPVCVRPGAESQPVDASAPCAFPAASPEIMASTLLASVSSSVLCSLRLRPLVFSCLLLWALLRCSSACGQDELAHPLVSGAMRAPDAVSGDGSLTCD